jgi:hypothetical protein
MASAGAHTDRTASPWRGWAPTDALYLTLVESVRPARLPAPDATASTPPWEVARAPGGLSHFAS